MGIGTFSPCTLPHANLEYRGGSSPPPHRQMHPKLTSVRVNPRVCRQYYGQAKQRKPPALQREVKISWSFTGILQVGFLLMGILPAATPVAQLFFTGNQYEKPQPLLPMIAPVHAIPCLSIVQPHPDFLRAARISSAN